MTISYVTNCKLLNVAGYQKRLLPLKLAALKLNKLKTGHSRDRPNSPLKRSEWHVLTCVNTVACNPHVYPRVD